MDCGLLCAHLATFASAAKWQASERVCVWEREGEGERKRERASEAPRALLMHSNDENYAGTYLCSCASSSFHSLRAQFMSDIHRDVYMRRDEEQRTRSASHTLPMPIAQIVTTWIYCCCCCCRSWLISRFVCCKTMMVNKRACDVRRVRFQKILNSWETISAASIRRARIRCLPMCVRAYVCHRPFANAIDRKCFFVMHYNSSQIVVGTNETLNAERNKNSNWYGRRI